ncbi:DUF427 domain-containing protein [Ideonella azotifigens]|uniref:DUF427 domain-containing protein n=1 Tax=Ideonella azotifigens TaxID=513160 RepID=A0ABP3V5I7_9BURK|nr:DUF427 domain-containing protein [Ideonella azotifigens]MCD2341122.1 DUF427 domain-containing protein [Ideonella azotifigens]
MNPSPGHKEHPEHHVRERHLKQRMVVEWHGQTLADSSDVIQVDEDKNPPRYYFPRNEVKTEMLKRTQTSSHCPFKGEASYYALHSGDQTLPDVIWSYEAPYDEHLALKDRMAFWVEKIDGLQIKKLGASEAAAGQAARSTPPSS